MKLKYMNTVLEQMKGLMFVKDIPRDYALVFPFKKRKEVVIHTWFCKFNLDIGLLDENNRVFKLFANVKPFRIIPTACNGFIEAKAREKLLDELMLIEKEKTDEIEDWSWRK